MAIARRKAKKKAAKKISKIEAYRLAKKVGCNFSKEFHAQSFDCSGQLAAIAKMAGYRKPASASGSTARYFFEHLDRLASKRGWH